MLTRCSCCSFILTLLQVWKLIVVKYATYTSMYMRLNSKIAVKCLEIQHNLHPHIFCFQWGRMFFWWKNILDKCILLLNTCQEGIFDILLIGHCSLFKIYCFCAHICISYTPTQQHSPIYHSTLLMHELKWEEITNNRSRPFRHSWLQE